MSGHLANDKKEYVWMVGLLLELFSYFLCTLQLLKFFIISMCHFIKNSLLFVACYLLAESSYENSPRKCWAFFVRCHILKAGLITADS